MQFIPDGPPPAVKAAWSGHIRSQADICRIAGDIFVQYHGGDGPAVLQLYRQAAALPHSGVQDYPVIQRVDAMPMLKPQVGCHMYLHIAHHPFSVHFDNGILKIAAYPGAASAGVDNLNVVSQVILQVGDKAAPPQARHALFGNPFHPILR
jgi:hypothetical protein